jgi:hypothetical protein
MHVHRTTEAPFSSSSWWDHYDFVLCIVGFAAINKRFKTGTRKSFTSKSFFLEEKRCNNLEKVSFSNRFKRCLSTCTCSIIQYECDVKKLFCSVGLQFFLKRIE